MDDWLGEQGELDWVDDPRPHDAAGAPEPAPPGRRAPSGEAPARARASDAVTLRRRRMLVLVALGVVVATVVGVVIATSGGGGSPTASPPTAATVPPAAQPPASTPPATGSTQSTVPAPTPALTVPAGTTLKSGDSGPRVVALQKALARLGLKVGSPDGSFGAATEAAVIAFQKAHGLSPDGIVGATTAKAIDDALQTRG